MTRERLEQLRQRAARGELGCGPVTEQLVRELLEEHERMLFAEAGAVAVACDALGVSADAVRSTAWSRVREEFPDLTRKYKGP